MINKKSVIQLIDSLNVGGAEMMSINIANLLHQEGHDSHICVTRKEGDLKKRLNNNGKYVFLNRTKVIDLKALKILVNYIRTHSIEIIHAHSTSILLAVMAKLVCWDLKIIWHDHYGVSEDLTKRPVILLKACSFFTTSILSVNKNLKDWADKKMICKDVQYFPNFSEFTNLEEVTSLYGIPNKRITMVAAIREQKDHMNLLKAFFNIGQNYSEWTLHIVGEHADKIILKKMNEYILKNSLSTKVFFYGGRNDIKNILNQTTIAVLSSKSEGLPLALLEYGLSKTPSISTRVGQCPDVLLDNNLLVEKQNPDELANAIIELINSEDYRKRAANELHSTVVSLYSKECYFYKLLKVYSGD